MLKQYDSIVFDYNASGIRTRKDTTTYELDGTTILSETGSGYTLRYYYDGAELVGFNFNNQDYFYEKNLQGDITGIYNTQGTLVGSYSYDAWGKCSITYDTAYGLAFLNPFRYRGYYYDRETGLYYLNSRYYDPNTGRFINADGVLGVNKDFAKYNLYAYCGNNPISRRDIGGFFWIEAVLVIVLLSTSLLTGCSTTISVGAAREYKYIAKSSADRTKNPNCYAYALGIYDKSYNPGDFSSGIAFPCLEEIVAAVSRDLKALGRSCRVLDSYDSPIEDNEYRIALSISDLTPIYENGVLIGIDYDCHFMVQTSTGGWAEKLGPDGETNYYDIVDPSDAPWYSPVANIYYNKDDIIYLAVTY